MTDREGLRAEPMTRDEQRAEADECVCGHWRAEHRHDNGDRFDGISCCLYDWGGVCPCDRFELAQTAPWSVMFL